ncbi:hypothetical protein AB0O34_36855 [Sphaerisporangium sp. NPDC088356]|uniref:hypothetical protein n=1 Tax=Sphaerisporangium sp. NPDC088356 TaxID=3154871 RepID=UPI0034132FAE
MDTFLSAFQGNADHGVHIPRWSGASGVDRVTWFPAWHGEERTRVLRWTCECRLKVYYLVTGGGRAWIRRQARAAPASDRVTSSDTERMRYPDAEMLWERILLGRAR